jgi:DNA-binding transcriptional LysR family regulator
MELRQLRHFVAAVECGNLSAAAEKVLISQPALSRSIKGLEDHLGTQLLERLPRGVVPTPAGRAFFRDAKFILNECAHVHHELRSFSAGKVGSVAIGVAPLFATYILPTVVEKLAEIMPLVDVSVSEGLNPELLDQLQEGMTDVLFTNLLPSKLPRGLTREPLCTVTSIIAVGADDSRGRKAALTGKDLVDARWVLIRHMRDMAGVGAYIVEQYMAQNQLPPPQTVLQTTSLSLVKELVLHHGFVSMLPDHCVAREMAAGLIKQVPMASGPFRRPAGLIYREASAPRPVLDRVINVFREVAKSMGRPATR